MPPIFLSQFLRLLQICICQAVLLRLSNTNAVVCKLHPPIGMHASRPLRRPPSALLLPVAGGPDLSPPAGHAGLLCLDHRHKRCAITSASRPGGPPRSLFCSAHASVRQCVPMHQCVSVRMHQCVSVPMHQCISVPMHQCVSVPMFALSLRQSQWCACRTAGNAQGSCTQQCSAEGACLAPTTLKKLLAAAQRTPCNCEPIRAEVEWLTKLESIRQWIGLRSLCTG